MNSYYLLRLVLPLIDRAPTDVTAQDLRRCSPRTNLPSPWTTWALIALIRHEARQRWVTEVVRTNIGKLRDGGGSGIVPGLPDWEYRFHGIGCCLTHRVSGEEIDVEYCESEGTSFDIFFYIRFLESLRHPKPPEDRLNPAAPFLFHRPPRHARSMGERPGESTGAGLQRLCTVEEDAQVGTSGREFCVCVAIPFQQVVVGRSDR